MNRPAIGEPDPGRAEPSRTRFADAGGGILIILAIGLALRLIIAYLLPGSGFRVDIASFQFWANNLADEGLYGFYGREFFHDYTPGYLYVLWLVGGVGNLLGGIGDLIKIPPVLADVGLGYVVWSMTKELGGSERAARLGALLVVLNPITWFDSVLWGQVDSVGVLVLLLALRELWRDRPERAAFLATLAALIKPQLGILIPIVAIVVIRRALWPKGGFGAEEPPEERASTTSWERRVKGPIRVVTTGLTGLFTAILLSLPFGLSFPGLVAQIFSTAAGYPYVTVNAFNPWALVTQTTPDGREEGLALNRAWICDSTIVPSPPGELRIGEWLIWSWPASTNECANGYMIGAFPAALVGAALFLIVAALVIWLVARRPDRVTMLVGLAVLALAFFVLPTRVHERYLFPLVALGAILAAVSMRWRVAYVLSSAATLANMYVILTYWYGDNPNISDWFGIGEHLSSWLGIAIAALTQAAVLGWAFLQLREEAVEGVREGIVRSGRGSFDESALGRLLGRSGLRGATSPHLDDLATQGKPAPATAAPAAAGTPAALAAQGAPSGYSRELPRWASALIGRPQPALAGAVATTPGGIAGSGGTGVGVRPGGAVDAEPAVRPDWDETRDAGSLGPLAWFRARLADTPVRADRSRELDRERGGRLDRLDVWILALLAICLLTVRMWRLPEPYQMHFDEVYHPRTATEFLQHWQYGISHDIYEWTHPHMAKYAMALGLIAFGGDHVDATSRLGVPVLDAAIEPRRDDGVNATRVEGDRLWVATGTEVRAYDLGARRHVATVPIPEAVAVAFDTGQDELFVGLRTGEIRVVNVKDLDGLRIGGPVELTAQAFMDVDGPIERLFATTGDRLAAVLAPGFGATEPTRSTIVVIDSGAATEVARPTLRGVAQLTQGSEDRIIAATEDGVAFIDADTGQVTDSVEVDGPVRGIVRITDIENDPIYASVESPEGPEMAVIVAKSDEEPRVERTFALPGAAAGRAYYDLASRMVHVEGTVGDEFGPLGGGETGARTVYVIEPHGNAVYADAELPFTPAVIVLDENQDYQWADRQQLLAIDESGEVASVEIGNHAFAWRVPGVIAGVLMALALYVLARLLFRRREIAVLLGLVVLVDGMLFVQSRIGMNDSYVGLGIIAAYAVFAALWLRPGETRRHWLAFALGVPLIGLFLGFALASKWVAAYAIGGLGILALTRSALGRAILIAGLIVVTTALGYIAISVPEGESGGNYVFLGIMIALVVVAVLANVLHPIAWTRDEVRFAVGAPAALGVLALLFGLVRGGPSEQLELGPVAVTPIELGLLGFVAAAGIYVLFLVLARVGFGPLAPPPEPDDPGAVLDPPADPPQGWLRLGAGLGLPAVWLAVGLLVIPVALYVAAYLPWAAVENHRIVEGWPAGNTGQTLLDLTGSMYRYHNNLSSAHPASSPWWAWMFNLKPVWFYEEGFAGRTSASIYDAGNLVAWWLAVPALAFVCWQAFRRRSPALALIAIGFAVQWISWARIDRAAFQYHYYTSLPFLFLALAYFLAELWHGPSRRTWLLARLAAGAAVLAPFGLWLLHRPLCAIARVTEVNPGSQACPTLIPDVTITPRAVAMAVVIGVGVLLLLRELLAVTEEDEPHELRDDLAGRGWRAVLARVGLGGRWARTVLIAAGTSIAFLAVSILLSDLDGLQLEGIPVEPIALVVTLALTPVAAYVATARDARRFVAGAIGAMAFWFVLWYPNIAALPLPAAIHNAYQGFLPTYLYPFQFWVMTTERPEAPSLLAVGPAIMLLSLAFMAIVVGYSAWSWRIALAERRRDRLARAEEPRLAVGTE